MVCDLSCLLLSKIKPNYGNWMAMHAEIKSFIKKHVNNNIQPPKKSLSFNTPNIDQCKKF